MVSDSNNPMEQGTLFSVSMALAEIKGILTTSLSDHGRQIADNKKTSEEIRTDLTTVANKTTTHEANISDIRQDVTDIRDKQNNHWTRFAATASSLVAVAAFLWSVFGRHF
jgi:uncharacterized protein HemX